MTRREAMEALLELAAHPDGVATALAEAEIHGERAVQCHCPVAEFLRGRGAVDVTVRCPSALVDGHYLIMPAAVCRFVRAFDAGEFPDLESDRSLELDEWSSSDAPLWPDANSEDEAC